MYKQASKANRIEAYREAVVGAFCNLNIYPFITPLATTFGCRIFTIAI
jgi:hypothetical protein